MQPVEKIDPPKELKEPVEKELQEKWTAAVKNISSDPQAVLEMLNDDLAGPNEGLLKTIVNSDVGEGLTALHLAAASKDLHVTSIIIARLIRNGANVNLKGGERKQTPLQLAVENRNQFALMALGAKADLSNEEGKSSLISVIEWAAEKSPTDTLFNRIVCNDTFRCEQNKKALFVAISCIQLAAVKFLLEDTFAFDLDVDDVDEKGRTLFDLITRDDELLKMLVAHKKIDLSAKDKTGRTVLDYAVDKNNVEMIGYLKALQESPA